MTNKTKTKIFIFATLLIASALFLFPTESNAGLVPCGRSADDPATAGNETDMCTLCHLVKGVYDIITWGRNIAVIVGIFFITVSGILYLVSGGNSALTSKAKDGIRYSLIGFALLLTAWIIINTILLITGADSGTVAILGNSWDRVTITCKSGFVGGGGTTGGAGAGGTYGPGGEVTPPLPGGPVTGCANSAECNSAYTSCPTQNWSATKCADCTGCVNVTLPLKSTWNSYTNIAKINGSLQAKMTPFFSSSIGSSMYMTEVWPPSVGHQSPEHADGRAGDLGFRNGSDYGDLTKLNAVCDSLKAQGLSEVRYEAPSRPAGLSNNCVWSTSTQPHFHVES